MKKLPLVCGKCLEPQPLSNVCVSCGDRDPFNLDKIVRNARLFCQLKVGKMENLILSLYFWFMGLVCGLVPLAAVYMFMDTFELLYSNASDLILVGTLLISSFSVVAFLWIRANSDNKTAKIRAKRLKNILGRAVQEWEGDKILKSAFLALQWELFFEKLPRNSTARDALTDTFFWFLRDYAHIFKESDLVDILQNRSTCLNGGGVDYVRFLVEYSGDPDAVAFITYLVEYRGFIRE